MSARSAAVEVLVAGPVLGSSEDRQWKPWSVADLEAVSPGSSHSAARHGADDQERLVARGNSLGQGGVGGLVG